MYTLIFGVAWTVIAAVFSIAMRFQPEWSDESLLFKVIMTMLPFAGLLAIIDGLRRVRRYRSVRAKHSPEGPIFVWTDFNGSERRDRIDPRPQWDKEDRNFAD